MKNYVLIFVSFFSCLMAVAQNSTRHQSNPITGGSMNVGVGSNYTHFGITPHYGVSINKHVDLAATFGVNFISISQDAIQINNKQTSFGPGAFVKLYPFSFLYLQGQYEFNFIKKTTTPLSGLSTTTNHDAGSFLLGGGITTGRRNASRSHFYCSVLWDLGDDTHSPYKDINNNAIPILRAGVNINLGRSETNSRQSTKTRYTTNRTKKSRVIILRKRARPGRW